jgi:hypothetical protein
VIEEAVEPSPLAEAPEDPFVVVGENLHATRVLLRSGRNVLRDGDREWIAFTDVAGNNRELPVPVWHTLTQEHDAGRLKHVAIAIRTAMSDSAEAEVT